MTDRGVVLRQRNEHTDKVGVRSVLSQIFVMDEKGLGR